MPTQLYKELAHRSIMRNRVRHRHDSFKPKITVLVTVHHTPAVWPVIAGMLDIVMAARVGLPDVDLAALDGLSGRVTKGTRNQAGSAFWICRDGIAVLHVLRLVGVEGAQDRPFRAVRRLRVIY